MGNGCLGNLSRAHVQCDDTQSRLRNATEGRADPAPKSTVNLWLLVNPSPLSIGVNMGEMGNNCHDGKII